MRSRYEVGGWLLSRQIASELALEGEQEACGGARGLVFSFCGSNPVVNSVVKLRQVVGLSDGLFLLFKTSRIYDL